MTQKPTVKTQGLTNLSENPEEQMKELYFAAKLEDSMENSEIPLENQLHIAKQVVADLEGRIG